MITISTKELRRFVSLASHIKDTRLIPIYGYVKFAVKEGKCTIYKSNGHSFIVCPVNAECDQDEVILVEETVLYGYVNNTSREKIKISADGNKGMLDDQKRPWEFQAAEDNYPAIQAKQEGETCWEFDCEVLGALSLAKPHTLPPQDRVIREWNTFVHVSTVGKKFGIAGFNGFTFYFQIFKQKLPEMVLDTDVISIISKFDSVTYSVAGNYDMFDCGGVTYGFIRPEVKARDLSKLFENLSKGEEACTANRKSLIEFCETVISTTNTNIPPTIVVSGDFDESKILLRHDGMASVHGKEEVWVEGKKQKFGECGFQPRYIILALKDLSYDDITINLLDNAFVFTSSEDKNYMGGVMKIALNNS
jgi:hypothetical protein